MTKWRLYRLRWSGIARSCPTLQPPMLHGERWYSSVAIEKHARAENHEKIWRTVDRTEGDRRRIMEACHSSS